VTGSRKMKSTPEYSGRRPLANGAGRGGGAGNAGWQAAPVPAVVRPVRRRLRRGRAKGRRLPASRAMDAGGSEMAARHLKIVAAAATLLVVAVALATCRGAPEPEGPPVAPAASTGPGAGGNAGAGQTAEPGAAIELTPALLEAYAKGLRKEVEIIRRPGRGTHYGVTVSKYGEEGPEVVRAAGLSHEDYRAVQDVVDRVFTTLNFQGKIGPARSIDLEKADPVWRE